MSLEDEFCSKRQKINLCLKNFSSPETHALLAPIFCGWSWRSCQMLPCIAPKSIIFWSIWVSRNLISKPTMPTTPTWGCGWRSMRRGCGCDSTHWYNCSPWGWTILSVWEWVPWRGSTANCTTRYGSSSCDYVGTCEKDLKKNVKSSPKWDSNP